VAKVLNFPKQNTKKTSGLAELLSESIKYPVPMYVAKLLLFCTFVVTVFCMLILNISADPVIKKISVVMFLAGTVLFFVLVAAYYCEKKWRFMSRNG